MFTWAGGTRGTFQSFSPDPLITGIIERNESGKLSSLGCSNQSQHDEKDKPQFILINAIIPKNETSVIIS